MALQTGHTLPLKEILGLLPMDREAVLRRGLLSALTERIWQLKERLRQLAVEHGSLQQLEQRIKAEGISPNDHSLYHDRLEWRAAQDELDRLLSALEKL
jgi:hypothetical protein